MRLIVTDETDWIKTFKHNIFYLYTLKYIAYRTMLTVHRSLHNNILANMVFIKK